MDLVIFEENKPFVLQSLGNGDFDYMESASEVYEADFFRFIKAKTILDKLADTYPTPRKKEDVPLWFYISMAHLTMRIVNISWLDFLIVQIPGFLVLIIISLINLSSLIALNYLLNQEMYLLKLLILFLISSMAFMVLLKTLPIKLIGEEGRNLIALYLDKIKLLSKRGIENADPY